MRFGKIMTAALVAAMGVAVPSMAKADHVRGGDDRGRVEVRHDAVRHEDVRRDVRVVHDRDFGRREVIVHDRPAVIVRDRPTVIVRDEPVYVAADCDEPVAIADVPACVIDAADRQCDGGPVEAVQYVRRGGETFYRVRVGSRHGDFDVRVTLSGGLLGVDRAY